VTDITGLRQEIQQIIIHWRTPPSSESTQVAHIAEFAHLGCSRKATSNMVVSFLLFSE
jgi:hypothetical protein